MEEGVPLTKRQRQLRAEIEEIAALAAWIIGTSLIVGPSASR
jgi:hypothetical protein